jgi:NADH:ubiquinone oxidoreductase subunit D
MKYIKLYEDNNWELTPEKRGELYDKYMTILETVEKETAKLAIDVTGLSVMDVFKDVKYYKQIVDKLEDRKAYSDNMKDEIYDLVGKYKDPYLSDLDRISSNLDWISMQLDDLKELLENMIYFAEHQKNHEIISDVLNGKSDLQINI